MNKNDLYQNFTDISLFFIGQEQCRPNHSYSIFLNDRYLMHYIVSGKGKFICNDKEYSLKAGDAFVIGCEYGGYYKADENDPWHYIWVNFGGEIAISFMKKLGLSMENPIYTSVCPEKTSALFQDLAENIDNNNKFLLYGKLFTVLGEMINNSLTITEERPSDKEYVSECKKYIKANYFKHICVSDLCTIVGLERSYLFRLFKAQTGTSPMEYIIKYRMSKAAQLLTDTSMSISEVALAVGYDDRFAFSKIFKNKHGISPREYRNTK